MACGRILAARIDDRHYDHFDPGGYCGGGYERSVLRAKEATLKQDLFIMRNAIQQYTLDKEAGPSSLDDLVAGKISFRRFPTDPITRNKDWHTESEQVLLDPLQTTPGITDVHSSSDQVSPFENTPTILGDGKNVERGLGEASFWFFDACRMKS